METAGVWSGPRLRPKSRAPGSDQDTRGQFPCRPRQIILAGLVDLQPNRLQHAVFVSIVVVVVLCGLHATLFRAISQFTKRNHSQEA
jgi:hypothetical protein